MRHCRRCGRRMELDWTWDYCSPICEWLRGNEKDRRERRNLSWRAQREALAESGKGRVVE